MRNDTSPPSISYWIWSNGSVPKPRTIQSGMNSRDICTSRMGLPTRIYIRKQRRSAPRSFQDLLFLHSLCCCNAKKLYNLSEFDTLSLWAMTAVAEATEEREGPSMGYTATDESWLCWIKIKKRKERNLRETSDDCRKITNVTVFNVHRLEPSWPP